MAKVASIRRSVLADIAEFDARRLYLPAAYPSMHAYCVGELRMSEDAAFRRIRAARVARDFPAILECVADGRLNLAGVSVLAPYVTAENASDLLEAAANRTKPQIQEMIAQRFPKSEEIGLVLAVARADELVLGRVESRETQLSPGTVESLTGGAGTRSSVAPIAHERYEVHFTVGRDMREKLCYLQDLLGHAVPSGDVAQIIERGFDALIRELERRKFAATTRPRRSTRPGKSPRHIPAGVRRAVWKRDGGQCTFVSESGHRCDARKFIEFDHIQELARGGRPTVGGIRLRCRAHNQYGAERTFGAGFMRHKREVAQQAAAARRRAAEEARATEEARRAEEARARAAAEEVIAPLRSLGFRADEARHAAALCESIPDAPLEQRVRRALSYFKPRGRTVQAMPSQASRRKPYGGTPDQNGSTSRAGSCSTVKVIRRL